MRPATRLQLTGHVALLLSLAVLFSLVLSPSAAALETISSGTSKTVTLAANSHDAYQVDAPAGKTANIEFTAGQAGSNVDFYVMTASGYAEYLDPNSPTFHLLDGAENAKSFTYSTTESGLIFVVDNDAVSSTGAPGTMSVTYVMTVLFETGTGSTGGPSFLSIAIAVIAGVAVFGSIAAVLLRQRKRRQAAAGVVPQPFLPPPPDTDAIPPPPPDAPAVPTPAAQLTSGAIHRALTPAERSILVQDWKNQKGKAAALPIVGLVLSVVYTMFPSLVMIGLIIPAFLAPAVAHAFAKHRRAIVAGNVVEFRGIPTVIGTEQVAKQQFYRLLFGTESVSVSRSLYGRLVPNQPNSLTVLEGVNTVIALNGMPLSPSTERVRLAVPAVPTTSLAGFR